MKRIIFLLTFIVLLSVNSLYSENYLYGTKGSTTLMHWPSNSIHYRVHTDGAGDNGLDYNATSNLIQAAYNVWNNVSTKIIWFYSDGSIGGSEDGEDEINGHYWVYPPSSYFGLGHVFYDNPNTPDVVEGASALTILEDENYVLTDVDIVYNGLKEWRGDNHLTWWNEVESVAIHEIGHSFGMAHATSGMSPIPVMTYAADPSSNRRELKFDDMKGISFLYGGNLIDNETFSGTVTYMWNLTVPSGSLLTIQSGSTINFQNGTSLTVNGSLNAQGSSASRITFTSSSGTWGGIRFNSGSSGSVQYCSISNAVNGIYCNGTSSPVIAYNNIFDCSTDGIHLSSSSPSIYNNTLSDNYSWGIYCNNSSPYLYNNTITGTSDYNYGYGLYCYGSSPYLAIPGTPPGAGHNVIRDNLKGIYAGYYSLPFLGVSPNYAGYNCIHDNSGYGIYAYYNGNGTIWAENNWWNSSHYFYTYQTTIDYSPELASDPNGCDLLKTSSSKDEIDSEQLSFSDKEFSELIKLELDGKYEEAILGYKQKFGKEEKLDNKKYSLFRIAECYRKGERKDFINFLENEIRQNLSKQDELYATTLELENFFLIGNKQYEKAIENFKTLRTAFSKYEETYKNALFNLGYLYSNLLNDVAKGKEFYAELKNQYPDDELTIHSMILMGEFSGYTPPEAADKKEIISITAESIEYSLSENYPNPFNPTTKISFNLLSKDLVKLKVFDILGREVAMLADNVYEAGKYEVEFDASNLPSGVYFYNLTTGKNSVTKKMLFLK